MDSYLGEIRPFAGNFAPVDWALCNGQLLPISQYTALFSLLGATYGGNGTSNFALPNLQCRAAMNQGQGPGLTDRVPGEEAGSATVTLLAAEMPRHTHAFYTQSAPPTSVGTPSNSVPAAIVGRGTQPTPYVNPTVVPSLIMSPLFVNPAGSTLPHNNQSPYLAVNFIISLYGEFPRFQ